MLYRWLTSAILLGVCPALAQVRLAGRVADENNAPVNGAHITLRTDTQKLLETVTDPTGAFNYSMSRPGAYHIDIERAGYFRLERQAVRLAAGDNEVHFILNRVRDVSDSVDVSAAPAGIEMDQTSAIARLSNNELINVPFPSGTNLRNAASILPGIIQDSKGNLHLNGGAEQQALYLLDGFNAGDPLTGQFNSRLSVEAVQSMEATTGRLPAEYGKGSSGVFAVNTRMGDDKLRYSATDFLPGLEDRKGIRIGSWTPRLNLLGPIRHGRAWFSDSFAAQYAQDVVRELPPGQDRTTSWRSSNFLHAQVNLSPSNILYAGFLANLSLAPRAGLSGLDPLQTTVDRRSRQWFLNIKDQIYLERGSVFEIGYASNRTFSRQVPQGHDLYQITPFGRTGNFFIDGSLKAARDQWLANYFLPSFTFLGGHQIKAGVDLDRVDYWQDLRRTGYEQLNQLSAPVRRVLFAGNGRLGRENFEASSYLQDSWRMRPNLLLEAGARSDWNQILRNWNWSPRVGLAWSPPRLERTKITAGYAVLYDAVSLPLFTRPDDQHAIITYFENGGEPAPPVLSDYAINRRHYASPRYRNWSGGVEQALPGGLSARLSFLRKRGSDGLSYFSSPQSETRYQLLNGRRDAYDSVEITLRQSLRKQYEWLASYTRSRAFSNAVLDVSVDDPSVVPYNVGRLPWDAPNRLLSWGFLPTFWSGWSLAYLVEWRTGFPFSKLSEDGHVIGGPNSLRFPDFFRLDLYAERRLRLRGQNWACRFGVNNITDHLNPNVVNNDVASPQFSRFYGGDGRGVNVRLRWLGKL